MKAEVSQVDYDTLGGWHEAHYYGNSKKGQQHDRLYQQPPNVYRRQGLEGKSLDCTNEASRGTLIPFIETLDS
jgi:hypothetical protein